MSVSPNIWRDQALRGKAGQTGVSDLLTLTMTTSEIFKNLMKSSEVEIPNQWFAAGHVKTICCVLDTFLAMVQKNLPESRPFWLCHADEILWISICLQCSEVHALYSANDMTVADHLRLLVFCFFVCTVNCRNDEILVFIDKWSINFYYDSVIKARQLLW